MELVLTTMMMMTMYHRRAIRHLNRSWGISMLEVLTGQPPYPTDLPAEALLYGLYVGTLRPAIPDGLSLHARQARPSWDVGRCNGAAFLSLSLQSLK